MMKNVCTILFFLTVIFSGKQVNAQADTLPQTKTFHVGVFAPLYLDSVFSTAGNFRFKEGMPKFIMPAVDFVNGVQIAFDSMKLNDENVEAYIYDTRSYSLPLASLIKSKKLDNLDLLIGSVKDIEYRQLADYALSRKIPFISATYPNDGGVTGNPYVVLLNSTLKAHCEAIYSYMLQNHGTDKIFLCRKKGYQEDRVASYFKMLNEQDGRTLLNIQTINFDSTISSGMLKARLDSNRQTVIIAGSLDEDFAMNLTNACYGLFKQYPITLIGMPNWDSFRGFLKKDVYEGFPVYFTTPYYNTKEDDNSKAFIDAYEKKLNGDPNDVSFKGYECAQLFTSLLARYGNDMMNHLNDKSLKVFTDYNFRPVFVKKTSTSTDYHENKHLYFVKIVNGTPYRAW